MTDIYFYRVAAVTWLRYGRPYGTLLSHLNYRYYHTLVPMGLIKKTTVGGLKHEAKIP
jgi:hypothetical protein